MAKINQPVWLEALPDDFELGPEFNKIQDAAQPDTLARLAQIIARYDGSNAHALAREIANMIFEGEPIDE